MATPRQHCERHTARRGWLPPSIAVLLLWQLPVAVLFVEGTTAGKPAATAPAAGSTSSTYIAGSGPLAGTATDEREAVDQGARTPPCALCNFSSLGSFCANDAIDGKV